MSKKIDNKAEARVGGIEQTLTKAEQFIETYQKQIIWGVGVVLGVVALYMAFRFLYVEKKSHEAAVQMFPAEQYFERSEWEKALNGDGNNLGFINIISDYKFTPSANLAKYYAGICHLRLNEYEEAIGWLGKYKPKDLIVSSIALGSMGDAYAELGDMDKAVAFYRKAADRRSNDFTSPLYLLRAGILLEQEGRFDEAIQLFERIKADFPDSTEGRVANKYITRVKVKQSTGGN